MLDGVMGYEAQIAGVGDHIPNQWLKSKVISYLKQKSVLEVKEKRIYCKSNTKLGIELRFVNGGGTGSIKQLRKIIQFQRLQ